MLGVEAPAKEACMRPAACLDREAPMLGVGHLSQKRDIRPAASWSPQPLLLRLVSPPPAAEGEAA